MITAKRLFELTLALVLWYFLAGLVLERVLGVLPAAFSREGFFLAGAALPWSLLLLGFLEPANSAAGAIVRDALFFVLVSLAIAVNALLIHQTLRQVWRLARIRAAIRR